MDALTKTINFDLNITTPPRFIAVEGPIGVGKTSLAKRLAETFNYDTLLEKTADNPFLSRFYQDRQAAALPTQLHFLLQRAEQIEALRQGDMFQPLRIADFLMDKDPLFARVTLDADELKIYQAVYQQLTLNKPVPDLVIYLQAPADVLMERINARGVASERNIDLAYLTQLNEAYMEFFHYYEAAPLLIINAADIDPINNEDDYRNLVDYLLSIKSGRHYYNPQTHL